MLGQQYLTVIRALTNQLESQELPHLVQLADQAADVVMQGGAIHVYDNGHLLNHELFNRAGGLALLGGLQLTPPAVQHDVRRREGAVPPPQPDTADERFPLAWAREVVHRSACRPGDLLIIGSVSGRSPFIVELALAARTQGIFVVGLTALAYARELPALHPSGQLLYQVCDDVIDMGTGPGDAALAVPGLTEKLGPTSGVMAALVAWCFVAELTEALLERGLEPTVFRSVNYPDGPAAYQAAVARYQRLGY